MFLYIFLSFKYSILSFFYPLIFHFYRSIFPPYPSTCRFILLYFNLSYLFSIFPCYPSTISFSTSYFSFHPLIFPFYTSIFLSIQFYPSIFAFYLSTFLFIQKNHKKKSCAKDGNNWNKRKQFMVTCKRPEIKNIGLSDSNEISSVVHKANVCRIRKAFETGIQPAKLDAGPCPVAIKGRKF